MKVIIYIRFIGLKFWNLAEEIDWAPSVHKEEMQKNKGKTKRDFNSDVFILNEEEEYKAGRIKTTSTTTPIYSK